MVIQLCINNDFKDFIGLLQENIYEVMRGHIILATLFGLLGTIVQETLACGYCPAGSPVCASDLTTYSSECDLRCKGAGVYVIYRGTCQDLAYQLLLRLKNNQYYPDPLPVPYDPRTVPIIDPPYQPYVPYYPVPAPYYPPYDPRLPGPTPIPSPDPYYDPRPPGPIPTPNPGWGLPPSNLYGATKKGLAKP